jgi:glycosyltransferase involved in cell wall biosynthesis
MPALNEEDNVHDAINETLRSFDNAKLNAEIIVVNDGSKDKTLEIIEKICKKDPRVRVISHDTPKGIGASFWDGVNNSNKDSICMLPGDGENDPSEIVRYLGLLSHVDIVIPFVFNPQVRPLWRSALSWIYRWAVNTTFWVNFNYTNGTILYRKKVLDELDHKNPGFFFQTDILIRSIRRGYLFAEVPYRLGLRGSGSSKALSYPSFLGVIRGYLVLVRDFYFYKNCKFNASFGSNTSTALRYKSSQENQ